MRQLLHRRRLRCDVIGYGSKAGKSVAAMSETGDKFFNDEAKSQRLECTRAAAKLANPFLQGVIDGFGGIDEITGKPVSNTAAQAFAEGVSRQKLFIDKETAAGHTLNQPHPSSRMINGGES
jgi:hypothetical protein